MFIHNSRNTEATWAATIMVKQNVVYMCDKILIQVLFKKECTEGGGLNANGPYMLKYLNAWFPVWEKVGGVALLKEVYHWGQGKASRFQKLMPSPVSFPTLKF